VSTLADDLRPYFAMDTSYDVIIGHSLGGPVVLSLLPFLPKKKDITVILVDPAISPTKEKAEFYYSMFLKEIANVRTADEHMAENPAWSRSDSALRALGVSMCDPNVVERVFQVIFQVWKWHAVLTASTFGTNSKTTHGISEIAYGTTFLLT